MSQHITFFYIIFGVIFSATAQICMKMATDVQMMRPTWILLITGSVLSYLISFVMYYFALKYYPISRVSPVMMTGVVILVVLYGFLTGEVLSIKQMIGILLGVFAIFLILTGV